VDSYYADCYYFSDVSHIRFVVAIALFAGAPHVVAVAEKITALERIAYLDLSLQSR
jgi:hypothetical protein